MAQAEGRKIRNREEDTENRGRGVQNASEKKKIYHIKGAFPLEICGLSPDRKIAYKG